MTTPETGPDTPDTPDTRRALVYGVHADGTECPHGLDPAELAAVAAAGAGQLDLSRHVPWAAPSPRCRAGETLTGVRFLRHPEAFCVMYYASDDGTEGELVYNARDGVTPFVISLRSGKTATHAMHQVLDKRMPPTWMPPAGLRVFLDLTPARARWHATRNADRHLADPALAQEFTTVYGDRDTGIADMAASYLEQPGAPDLVDPGPEAAWTPDWQAPA